MATKGRYLNKYRYESPRASWWNYGWAGSYFVTICTKDRIRYFGNIQNGTMILSDIGLLANKFWHEIPDHAKNVELGSFVVMSDHIHGILILGTGMESAAGDSGMGDSGIGSRHAMNLPPMTGTDPWKRFQNQGKNTVSSIIGSYKSAVTRHARLAVSAFGWQSLYHDHIIRNDGEFHRISRYIESNPKNWKH